MIGDHESFDIRGQDLPITHLLLCTTTSNRSVCAIIAKWDHQGLLTLDDLPYFTAAILPAHSCTTSQVTAHVRASERTSAAKRARVERAGPSSATLFSCAKRRSAAGVGTVVLLDGSGGASGGQGAGLNGGTTTHVRMRSHSFTSKLSSRLAGFGVASPRSKGSTGEMESPGDGRGKGRDGKEREKEKHVVFPLYFGGGARPFSALLLAPGSVDGGDAGKRPSQIVYASGFVTRLVTPVLADPRAWKAFKMEVRRTKLVLHKQPGTTQYPNTCTTLGPHLKLVYDHPPPSTCSQHDAPTTLSTGFYDHPASMNMF
ncbi:hypothetical protein B0H17DRAFT_1212005 [Mycena rosella]|uniref:Uncharacterized protein n=1 Tax=Mycena rosella TaxID=1033263 RepID=A0AAD7CT84_MYCRO|nr:hypothetical protein B0H17DRAFT_1212005 [Mycena rosella]